MFAQIAIACLAFGMTISAAGSDNGDALFSMGGFQGEKLERAIERAEQHALGSKNNPIRVNMPQGQKAYLSRLRCADGTQPVFERNGSAGPGPFGSIADNYSVDCKAALPGKVSVYLDMYHPGHQEIRPVPGFTMDR